MTWVGTVMMSAQELDRLNHPELLVPARGALRLDGPGHRRGLRERAQGSPDPCGIWGMKGPTGRTDKRVLEAHGRYQGGPIGGEPVNARMGLILGSVGAFRDSILPKSPLPEPEEARFFRRFPRVLPSRSPS